MTPLNVPVSIRPTGCGIARIRVTLAGGVVASGPEARDILSQADGLRVRDGRLHVSHPASARALADAIRIACTLAGAPPQALVIERNSGCLAYQVVVTAATQLTSGHAVVHLSDPCATSADYSDALQQAYGLTDAEAAIAGHIVAGLDVRQIADRRSVSPFTVRALLKRCFAKTGVSRQVDLVRLVLSGALIRCVGTPRPAPIMEKQTANGGHR